jgi:ParB family chromosome partitioning protein
MNATHKGLGKGLSALMGEDYSQTAPIAEAPKQTVPNTLPLGRIHSGKFQPRVRFDEEYLNELADSIEKNGIMQPIIVRPSPEKSGMYEIIAGERRWRAAGMAKLAEIPVIIREVDDQLALELALVENIQRQDLTPLEESAGYQRLMDEFGYTQEELARTVGKSRSHIANLLRLLTLPEEIKHFLESDELSMGHARALLNADKPVDLAREVVKRGLNVRQTENLVRTGGVDVQPPKPRLVSPANGLRRAPARDKDPDILALEETLSDNLGLKVSINDHGGQKGEIVVQYSSLIQLDEILRRLGDSI